jgi:hypothetical protein
MTVAVVDRLVHHATIFEMNVESYRRRAALERKRGRGRPPIHTTAKSFPIANVHGDAAYAGTRSYALVDAPSSPNGR